MPASLSLSGFDPRARGARRALPRERTLRMAAAVLACAGIGVAAYIAVVEAGGGSPVCLAGSQSCQTVAESSYAELAGINVAVIGVAGYVLLLGSALAPGDPGRFAGLLLATVGFGFSVYLTYLELFVINATCQWCVASAVLMTLILLVTATRAFAYAATEMAVPQPLEAPSGNEEEAESPDG